MNRTAIFIVALIVLVSAAIPAWAQTPIPPPQPDDALRSGLDLDQLLGPIALYPDPLIAQILPAATLPTQVVLAERYLDAGNDPNQIDAQPWDPSVKALARYPTVLKMLSDNLAWTTDLGQAFLNQQQDVMDSIQRLRAQAQTLGNLQSTPQQTVDSDDGDIEIIPADPDQIYVPDYQPDVVYYQLPYGQTFITFGIGFPVGLWLNHDFDWHDRNIIAWGRNNPRPSGWWRQPPRERFRPEVVSRANVWQPRGRAVVNVPNRGDRGYVRPVVVTRTETRPVVRPPVEHSVTIIGHGASPAPVREAPSVGRNVNVTVIGRQAPRPSGALIGVQSARDTRAASTRGQQSRGPVAAPVAVTRSAPPAAASHSAAPSGGGSRGESGGGGGQPRR